MSVGDLAAFSLYSLFVGGSATGLATAYGDLMQAAGAADRVFKLTHPGEDSKDWQQTISEGEIAEQEAWQARAAGVAAASGVGGAALEFRSVQFAYPTRPEAQILSIFDLSIAPGEFYSFFD